MFYIYTYFERYMYIYRINILLANINLLLILLLLFFILSFVRSFDFGHCVIISVVFPSLYQSYIYIDIYIYFFSLTHSLSTYHLLFPSFTLPLSQSLSLTHSLVRSQFLYLSSLSFIILCKSQSPQIPTKKKKKKN